MNTKNSNFTFTNITKDNANQYKKLRKVFARYKIQTLRNHGEAPGGKKVFYKLLTTSFQELQIAIQIALLL